MRCVVYVACVVLVATCTPRSRPPSVVANRDDPENWHLLALPGPDGEASMVSDLLVAHGEVWIAEGVGVISRLDGDGRRTEVARIDGYDAPRLLAQPDGIAVITGVQGAQGVRVTWLDRTGKQRGAPGGLIDVWPATLHPLHAVARPDGGIVLFGQRGYSMAQPNTHREVCVVVELDAAGTLLRRRELATNGWRCVPAGVDVIDSDVILGLTTDSAVPELGSPAPAVQVPIGFIARLGPDGPVWHRALAITDANVDLADLAIAGGTVAAVGMIEQNWGGAGYTIEFGPSPYSMKGSASVDEPRERVAAVGLDLATGASRWLRVIPATGELAFLPYSIRAAGGGDRFAIALQPVNTGEIAGERIREGDVYIAALDGATGTPSWNRIARADQRGSADGIVVGNIVVTPDGATLLVGGFRRELSVGAALIEGRFEEIEPCKNRASRVRADPTLFATLPPPDPCRTEYVEPLIGFAARITR